MRLYFPAGGVTNRKADVPDSSRTLERGLGMCVAGVGGKAPLGEYKVQSLNLHDLCKAECGGVHL